MCRSVLGVHWKDWCWSWNSNTLATWSEELTHWKRPWCWEGLGAGGEGGDRGWDGWMASPTRWAWVWVNSGSLWWTGRAGVLRFMGSQRVGHDWATELNWTELNDMHVEVFKWKCTDDCKLFAINQKQNKMTWWMDRGIVRWIGMCLKGKLWNVNSKIKMIVHTVLIVLYAWNFS